MASLNSEIKAKLMEAGASLVGFADISDLPAETTRSMTSAISIAVALESSIIKEIANGPTNRYYQEYNRINGFLPTRSLSRPNGTVNMTMDAVITAEAIAISKIDEPNQSLCTTMKYGQAIDIAKEKNTPTKLNLRKSLGCESNRCIGGNFRGPLFGFDFSLIVIESKDADIPKIAVRKNGI